MSVRHRVFAATYDTLSASVERRELAPRRARLLSDADAEHLPLPDGAPDAVVFTLVLCSVPDQRLALLEARRVLKPGGTLAVLEHVRGQGRAARCQDRLDGLWGRCVAPGCQPQPERGGIHRRSRVRVHGSQQVGGPGGCPGHAPHRGHGKAEPDVSLNGAPTGTCGESGPHPQGRPARPPNPAPRALR